MLCLGIKKFQLTDSEMLIPTFLNTNGFPLFIISLHVSSNIYPSFPFEVSNSFPKEPTRFFSAKIVNVTCESWIVNSFAKKPSDTKCIRALNSEFLFSAYFEAWKLCCKCYIVIFNRAMLSHLEVAQWLEEKRKQS